jgi:long-chain acyl-CoA synthetase
MNAPLALAAGHIEVAGIKIANGKHIDGHNLVLNGAGVRTLALFKVYVAALYVSHKTKHADDIINSSLPQCVELVLKRNIEASMILSSFQDAIKQNLSKEEMHTLQPRFAELDRAITAIRSIKEGDRLCLDFAGDGTTRVIFNDELKETILGNTLSRALLKIWLGKKPVQDNLKKALLDG